VEGVVVPYRPSITSLQPEGLSLDGSPPGAVKHSHKVGGLQLATISAKAETRIRVVFFYNFLFIKTKYYLSKIKFKF